MKTNLFIFIRYLRVSFTAILLVANFYGFSQSSTINAYAVFSDSARVANSLAGNFYFNDIDTNEISFFEMKVGVAENDSSLLYVVIPFDSGSLPAGISYSRMQNRVCIGVTGPQPAWTYYCAVRLKNNQGNWSQANMFLAN